MKKIMKTVQSSYLHLSNILSSQVEFSNRIIESSFSTRLECLSSTSQLDSTLFQKNLNSTRHFSSRVLDLNSSTQLDAISLDFRKSLNSVILHVVDEDLKIMLHDSINFLNLIIDFKVIHC